MKAKKETVERHFTLRNWKPGVTQFWLEQDEGEISVRIKDSEGYERFLVTFIESTGKFRLETGGGTEGSVSIDSNGRIRRSK